MAKAVSFCELAFLYLVHSQQQLYQSAPRVPHTATNYTQPRLMRSPRVPSGWNGTGILNHDWRRGWCQASASPRFETEIGDSGWKVSGA